MSGLFHKEESTICQEMESLNSETEWEISHSRNIQVFQPFKQGQERTVIETFIKFYMCQNFRTIL